MTYNFLVWVCSGIYGIMRYLHICKGNNLGLKLLFAGSKKADVSLLFCHHYPCRYPWSYGARMYHCVARPCNVPNFTLKFIEKEDIRRPTRIFFFDVSDCTCTRRSICAMCNLQERLATRESMSIPNLQESPARRTSALPARLPALLMRKPIGGDSVAAA